MSLKPFLLLGFLFFACSAWAGPEVLYDNGKTVPVDQFVNIKSSIDGALKSIQNNRPSVNSLKEKKIEPATNGKNTSSLPLRTPSLSVGIVKKRQVNLPDLKTPVCVVGSDNKSLKWLTKNHDQLARIGTRCLLIQAENQSDIDRVKKQAEGLSVIVVSGDAMTSSFGLEHYPALISKKWIEQ